MLKDPGTQTFCIIISLMPHKKITEVEVHVVPTLQTRKLSFKNKSGDG